MPPRAASRAAITWRIQGTRGGEALVDRVRGPLNNGGLFGERAGWHLPGFPDRGWSRAATLAQAQPPGVVWYRTGFHLGVPAGQDVSIGLRFAGTATGSSGARALVFLNGWQIGHFIDATGLQRDFVLPAGILHQQGDNTLAIAVISPDALPTGPGPISLVMLGNQRGGVTVEEVDAPGFESRDRDRAHGW